MSDYLTVTEAAEVLDLHPRTIRRWINKGYGPAAVELPNGRYRFPAAEFNAWLAENLAVSN